MEKEKKSQISLNRSKEEFEEVLEYEEVEYEYVDNFQTHEHEFEGQEEEDEESKIAATHIVKQRRCIRRKKVRRVCCGSEGEDEGSIEEGDEEEDEEEDGEEEESDDVSESSSVFDPISFEWENEVFEFEELCDPGTLQDAFKRYYEEPDYIDHLGVNRYLHLCNALSITPMVRFCKALSTGEVDLSYRSIDSKNIRAMCGALEMNTYVQRLILKFNKLLEEDCHYVGIMLYYNETISVLDLTGCRLGPDNIKLLTESLAANEALVELNLSKCNIQDEGVKELSKVMLRNNSIRVLDLSYNKLGDVSAEALGLVLKGNESLRNLNLCYNNLFDPVAMKPFFRGMATNKSVTHLNLAWNAMSGSALGKLIKAFLRKNSSILVLDLSDNRLEGTAVAAVKNGLNKSQSLEILKLGKNPISPEQLETLLNAVKNCSTLKLLDLEDLWVKKSFDRTLKRLQQTRDVQVNIGGIFSNYEIKGPDYPKLILKRAKFEAMKPKSAKKRKDFGHLIWSLGDEPLTPDEFMVRVKRFKAKINKQLYPELMKQFTIPKVNLIDVVAMRQKYLSIFPDSQPPPLPKKEAVAAVVAEEIKTAIEVIHEGVEEGGEEGGEEIEYIYDEEEEFQEFVVELNIEEEPFGEMGNFEEENNEIVLIPEEE